MGVVNRIIERLDPKRGIFGEAIKTHGSTTYKEPTAAQVRRQGFEYGVQLGGSNHMGETAYSAERLQILQQLYSAYITCPWVSGPIDLIARTSTGGGLDIVVDDVQDHDGEIPEDPPEVQALRRMINFVNPREDMIQLLRSCIIDLELFGDAFIEIVTLLGQPVALYTLDATTMTVLCDEHGEISGYKQDVDGIRQTRFDPEQVIHISLDAPRGGVYGVSPAQKALLPVTAWLFTEATIKENFRRGDPPRIHVDLGSMKEQDVRKWQEQYSVLNLGPKAVGNPITTTGGGVVNPIDPRKVQDYLATSKQLRDEIISCFGTPPSKLGIIETGNIGAGTGEAQDKTFRVNTIIPVQALVLEKINYQIVKKGFGIEGWHLEFGEVDYRDSKVVEEIRDMRLRNGSYTLNRYRDEIGEPPVDGGDSAVLIDRQNLVLWSDIAAMSVAGVAYKVKDTSLDVSEPQDGKPVELEKPDPPEQPTLQTQQPMDLMGGKPAAGHASGPNRSQQRGTGPDPTLPSADRPGGPKDATQGKAPRENRFARDTRNLSESWDRAYAARRKQALKELKLSEVPDPVVPLRGPQLPVDQLESPSDHQHHASPDYSPAEIGLNELNLVAVDPREVRTDHTYQRQLVGSLVQKYAANRQELAQHVGLLAIRPDGSKWVVSGQHHTAAAVEDRLDSMSYQSFVSTGPEMEAEIYRRYQAWHQDRDSHHPVSGGVALGYEVAQRE